MGTSEDDSSDEVQVTSVKLFGKTVVIPDPRKRCSPDTGSGHENGVQTSQSSNKGTSQAPLDVETPTHTKGEQISQSSNKATSQAPLAVEVPTYTKGEQVSQFSNKATPQAPLTVEIPTYAAPPRGWVLPYNSFPLHFGESAEARITPLHMWWPYFGFPIGHPRGPSSVAHNEATDESEAAKSPLVESSSKSPLVESRSDSDDNTQLASNNEWKVLESLGTAPFPRSASNFELKPSTNSAFVRVKPIIGSGEEPARGFVPYKRCRVE